MRPIRHAAMLAAGLLAAALTVPLAPSSPVPTASSAPPGVSKPDCGARVAKPGGGNWTCTMVDHFSGTALEPSRWMGMAQAGSGDLCILNSPRTVAVSNGSLRLSAIATDATTQCPLRADGTRASYASGWATTYRRFSQQYGRFEARIKVQAASAPGLHEAFWLWPDIRYGADSPWPESGEIDIVETFSSSPDLAIPFLHYSDDQYGGVQGVNTAWNCPSSAGSGTPTPLSGSPTGSRSTSTAGSACPTPAARAATRSRSSSTSPSSWATPTTSSTVRCRCPRRWRSTTSRCGADGGGARVGGESVNWYRFHFSPGAATFTSQLGELRPRPPAHTTDMGMRCAR